MIEAAMYVLLGFCTAGLIGLAVLPAFYRRAARLTEEALRAVNPSSYAEVRAAQDHERVQHALSLRRVERQLELERQKALESRLEAGKLLLEVDVLKKQQQTEQQSPDSDTGEREYAKAVDFMSAEIVSLKSRLVATEGALQEAIKTSPSSGSIRRIERQLENERKKASEREREAGKLQTEIDALVKRYNQDGKSLGSITADEQYTRTVDLMSAEIVVLKEKLANKGANLEKARGLTATHSGRKTELTADNDTGEPSEGQQKDGFDTMELVTITGLEAQVATLKSKLAAYEQAGENRTASEPEIVPGNARSIIADLESQLVDADAKFISAQAEVARLSVQLDLAGLEESEALVQLRNEVRMAESENALIKAMINDKERSLDRARQQLIKLQGDLSRAPELSTLRDDLKSVTGKVSEILSASDGGAPAPKPRKRTGAAKTARRLQVAAKPASSKRPAAKHAGRNGSENGHSSPNGTPAKETVVPASEIADAASALVDRVVNTARARKPATLDTTAKVLDKDKKAGGAKKSRRSVAETSGADLA